MEYEIIEKKRFVNKVIKLLEYLETNWNHKVATNFYETLIWHINLLQQHPFIGKPTALNTFNN